MLGQIMNDRHSALRERAGSDTCPAKQLQRREIHQQDFEQTCREKIRIIGATMQVQMGTSARFCDVT